MQKHVQSSATIWPRNPSPEYIAREDEISVSTGHLHPTFTAILCVWQPNHGAILGVYVDAWRMKPWSIIYRLEWNPAILDNMDKTEEHSITWNTSSTERELTCAPLICENLKHWCCGNCAQTRIHQTLEGLGRDDKRRWPMGTGLQRDRKKSELFCSALTQLWPTSTNRLFQMNY